MEQTGKRRQFDAVFKAEAVRMVTQGGYTQAQAARQLGIKAKRISHWIKQMQPHSTKERTTNSNHRVVIKRESRSHLSVRRF